MFCQSDAHLFICALESHFRFPIKFQSVKVALAV